MLLQSHRLRDASTTIQDIGIKGFAYHVHQRQTQTYLLNLRVKILQRTNIELTSRCVSLSLERLCVNY